MTDSSKPTVTLLPVPLALIHIPRSRVAALSHPIVEQLLLPSSHFLNITCNEIELSIFANCDYVERFAKIARIDRRRQRGRRRASTRNDGRVVTPPQPEIEVSCEEWKVLQIDTHDGLDTAGARVRELSAPLAAAGISIFYQSSHQSDFIIVKSVRIGQVMQILAESQSYNLYSDGPLDITTPTSRARTPPVESDDDDQPFENSLLFSPHRPPSPPPVDTPRPRSHSSGAVQVSVLDAELSWVGLPSDASDGDREHWSFKLLKLIAYPDLIIPSTKTPVSPKSALFDRFASFDVRSLNTPDDLSDSDASDSASDSFFSCPSPHTSTSPSRASAVGHQAVSNGGSPLVLASKTLLNGPPFYSITFTAEGSSLVTSLPILAALFPKADRHQVISGEELTLYEQNLTNGKRACHTPNEVGMTCLQIDLQKYGLDKHGLVNRFSQVLESNQINHMYSSTFKTANVLVRPFIFIVASLKPHGNRSEQVDKIHAGKAAALLRSC
ncbi:hypothetical protein SISSUDRAFT_624571 [Sistotremastrum suecicum HHB10207 ss-3]|uniref:CASTOR ACT domain-containing protein n=1 Tax=Sistotremastrum suecicum HHB10207 ss-3 TaxID=1314776 RepID=A0A166EJB0_9AGAM|nr:hypothetical protein SISSUDRAFT_624571 [Sistotremastrum suecicum HHB10207 ss-3]